MFKDYDKYLSTSLKVYIFVLLCVFIMKIVGLDYFGLDVNNPIVIQIDNLLHKYYLANAYNFFVLYLYTYFIISLVFNENNKNIKIYSLIATIIGVLIKVIENFIGNAVINFLIDFMALIFIVLIINIKYKRKVILKTIKFLMLSTFYQLITLFIRNINYQEQNSFILNCILAFDYILMLLITYNLKFMKGDKKICGITVGLSLLKKIHLKKLLKRLQKNLHKFKQLSKEEKLSISIYIFLSLIWNTFTIILIFIIAKLNNTLIECLFIVTSFWLSKHSFGRPFHLSSMVQCFIVSNISYYILNRITTPLGISIFVPILLGVGLSYLTSKLVKKTYKPLYKGMSKELFEETILKVTDKNSSKYKVCYDFYIRGKSDLSLSFEYNYSIAGIRKIRNRINDKIRELN